jgi:predicted metal-dependent phosphoesterase TrpH
VLVRRRETLAERRPGLALLREVPAERRRAERRERVVRIVEALVRAGVRVAVEEIFAEAGDGTIGRAHVARVLVRRGLASSFARAYDRYLGRHAPAYVPSSALSTGEAIRRIHLHESLSELFDMGNQTSAQKARRKGVIRAGRN